MYRELTDSYLILENKIVLFNHLTQYFKLRDVFFSLNSDLIITGNEQYPKDASDVPDTTVNMVIAERIKRMVEKTQSFDSSSTSSDNLINADESKEKLIRLTHEKE